MAFIFIMYTIKVCLSHKYGWVNTTLAPKFNFDKQR